MRTRVGHYEILEKLGEGGMGVVYKARDTRLDRFVALKMLPDEHLDYTQRDRLIREARTASALNHPNIVTIYEIDSVDGMQIIAMEYVRGRSLAELVQPGGLPLADVLRYGLQLCEGVGKAHGAGIIHRDLKPANMMWSDDGLVKVLDFGLAKKYTMPESNDSNTTVAAAITRPGLIIGTVAYMSPEQAAGDPVDLRSDIFSLGVILYELLSGVRPFVGNTTLATLQKLQVETPKRLTTMRADLPESLEAVIGKALQKDRSRRYQTMHEMRTALMDVAESLIRKQSEGLAVARRLTNAAAMAGSVVRRRPLAASFMFVLLVLTLVVVAINHPVFESTNAARMTASASDWGLQAQAWMQRFDKPQNVDNAIDAAKKALEQDPNYAMAHVVLAEAYYRKNVVAPDPQWERLAAESGRKAVELNPDLAAAHIADGIVLMAANRIDDAGGEFQRAADLEPLNAFAAMWQGEYYFRKTDLAAAEERYRRAVELNDRSWIPRSYLGTFLYRTGRYVDAAAAYEAGLERTADNLVILRNVAAVYHALDQYEKAASALQRALEIQPTAGVYSNLGTARFFQGRYADAAAAFDKAVQLNPTRYLYWGNLGDSHRWIPGNEKPAKDAYRHAIGLVLEKLAETPADPEMRASLAVYYAKSGDSKRAADALAELEQSSKRPPGTYFKAMLAYEITGKRQRALDALHSALKAGYALKEIKNEPELTSLRSDRRYHHLLANF